MIILCTRDYIPVLPFENFKWKWATLQCTEGLNDPVVLLGILTRCRRLELQRHGLFFSSDEFAEEMNNLADAIANIDEHDIGRLNLRERTGDRNIIRNSRQYWSALGLLPQRSSRPGLIELTPFGQAVADRHVSQAEFAAITIQTFRLPNPVTYRNDASLWEENNLQLHPLQLILQILHELYNESHEQGYITVNELIRIIIPLSAVHTEINHYVRYIIWYRNGELDISNWPNCTPAANDIRIAREFLLFLQNYGYIQRDMDVNVHDRTAERYQYNDALYDEIETLINRTEDDLPENFNPNRVNQIRNNIQDVVANVERIRVRTRRNRPHQAQFRREVLQACERCLITNVEMPEVLEAAHIRPFAYNGEDTVANGFALRTDIHILFDTGHLRIDTEGNILLSERARMNYGAIIPPAIRIPDFTNREFLRWRWENYNSI